MKERSVRGRTGVSRAAAELGVCDQFGEHTVSLPWIGWGTLAIGSILSLTLAVMKATLVRDRLRALRRMF